MDRGSESEERGRGAIRGKESLLAISMPWGYDRCP
jgi:hypothetical protein